MASQELINYVKEIIDKSTAVTKNREPLDIGVIEALFQASQVAMFTEKDLNFALNITRQAKALLDKKVVVQTKGQYNLWTLENYSIDHQKPFAEVDLFYEMLKQESYYNFQSFMYYMERHRGSRKRFYYPRRKVLKPIVDDLTDFEMSGLKFYGLSLPPRVGKSTICIFFLSWVMLRRPEAHNAMCGHSGVLAKGFYKEIMNFLTSSDYTFKELFDFWHPNSTFIQDKSAEDCTVTLKKPSRFPSLTCRGIDGTWTGAVDVSGGDNVGYLYVDDLVRDREESMSVQRMENLYQTYQNTVLDRKNDGSKELMVGTLWSVNDPLERTRVAYSDDPKYKFRRIPALNDYGQSNFVYDFNGFSTSYYVDLRKRLDKAEWEAKYQQRPFVREGLLFPSEELRYFNGEIPDEARKHETLAVIDPAFGGGDSLSMPICLDYGLKERYVVDWVFDRGTQSRTVPRIVSKVAQHYITRLRIERNSGGQLLADSIKKEMEKQNVIHCKIELIGAPVKLSKEDKISAYSDFVKENLIFLLPTTNPNADKGLNIYKRSNDYQKAMDETCMYSAQGKQPHDDAPDSLAQLAMMFDTKRNGTVEVPHNPFRGLF